MNRKYNFVEGEVLLFDKPPAWTSFDVVNKVRAMLGLHLGVRRIKVGHTGTLDPLATGLLIVCTGKATKQIAEFTEMDKEYTGAFVLGATTPTFDKESGINQRFNTGHITGEMLRETAMRLTGKILQTPPAYSAKRVDGEKAYVIARKGEIPELKSRYVVIKEFEIGNINLPEVDFRVVCSKGTYIRSLAVDFGKALKSGGYLGALCRTRIGNFLLDDAFSIGKFETLVKKLPAPEKPN